MSLYVHKEKVAPTKIDNFFRRENKQNFLIEVENLFCRKENCLESVSKDDVSEIAKKYKVNVKHSFSLERRELLSRLLVREYSKENISGESENLIHHLEEVLFLKPGTVETIKNQEKVEVYTQAVKKILSGAGVTEDDKKHLAALRKNFCLEQKTADDIYRSQVKNAIDAYTKPVFDSHIFSPEDERQMYEGAKKLGLSLSFPEDVKEKLRNYRENWELSQGRFPVVLSSPIILQAGEKLHFKTMSSLVEEKTVTHRVGYSGLTYSTKVIGNLRWRWGNIKPQTYTTSELKNVDEGNLYLTNKRLVFVGVHQTKSIPLSKIVSFTPYTNGLLVRKDNSKPLFFSCSCNMEALSFMLTRLVQEK